MAHSGQVRDEAIGIVLADDHTMVRRGLSLVPDSEERLTVLAEAGDIKSGFRARFERECRVAASLEHPHVVPIYHAGREGARRYVTMRFVDGTDLRALLAEEGRLEPERATRLVEQVAGALDEAHRRGLVHRDVKPGNILIESGDGRERAYLTDFGITKQRAAGPELTRTGMALGTADYMAPEQARGGEVDGRADVYSLGCVLFRALTGEVVFDRDSDLKEPADRPQTASRLAREARSSLRG